MRERRFGDLGGSHRAKATIVASACPAPIGTLACGDTIGTEPSCIGQTAFCSGGVRFPMRLGDC